MFTNHFAECRAWANTSRLDSQQRLKLHRPQAQLQSDLNASQRRIE